MKIVEKNRIIMKNYTKTSLFLSKWKTGCNTHKDFFVKNIILLDSR